MLKILITKKPFFFPPLIGKYMVGKKIPLLNQSKGEFCEEAYFDYKDPKTGLIQPFRLHYVSIYDTLKVMYSDPKIPKFVKDWFHNNGYFFIENNSEKIEEINLLLSTFGKIYTSETRGEPYARWPFEAETCEVIEEEWYSCDF